MAHRHHVDVLYANTSSEALQSQSEKAEYQHGVGIALLDILFAQNRRQGGVYGTGFKYRQFGKPYIEGGPEFSVAHSGDIVVAAISNGGEIGIDIEIMRNLPWEEYTEMFATNEQEIIRNSVNPTGTLLDLWVKKESVLKAEGCGLQMPFSQVEFNQDRAIIRSSGKKFYLTPVPIEGCYCYLCTYENNVEVSVREHRLS